MIMPWLYFLSGKPLVLFELEAHMLRITPYYFYSLGFSVHRLSLIKENDPIRDWEGLAHWAKDWLNSLYLPGSLYKLKSSRETATELYKLVEAIFIDKNRTEPIHKGEVTAITDTLTRFETALQAELGVLPIYIVASKAGYDVDILLQNGEILFPPEASVICPNAISDMRDAAQCIAYNLATSAAFHIHRVNEAILGCYYDAVGDKNQKPKEQNIGVILRALQQQCKGSKKVLDLLTQIKDDYRNPIIHPQDRYESVHDAIALLHIVHSAIVWMLKDIPLPPLAPSLSQ